MRTILFFCLLTLISSVGFAAQNQTFNSPNDKTKDSSKKEFKPAELPITTIPGPVGDLLRGWWKEKTAAGNVGDWYDNRDEAHSLLDTKPFPQLKVFVYTPEELKARANWAAARVVRPFVTLGNSSTSAPPTRGGSNPRLYYGGAKTLEFLHEQYTKNNLYIYPEHKDYDPGHNGTNDGYGDLYPTNTPYLIISQGSSYTDQPFMQAIPLVMAAFSPEVKKKLVETGLLMPTIQQIFRQSNKHLKSPAEYLTGKAHPPVFEGAWVDTLAMVKAAHELKIGEIAPIVSLKVLSEDRLTREKDFFSILPDEQLGNTPAVIARLFLGLQKTRKMSVSAATTKDPGGKPLKFTWVVLQGDPKSVRLKSKGENGSECDIEIDWQARRPVSSGSPMESNRIDIGVFANNGARYSAPSFITWFFPDCEDRIYDDKGRLRQVSYLNGDIEPQVTDWESFAEKASSPEGVQALQLSESEKDQVAKLVPLLQQKNSAIKTAKEELKSAQEALKKAGQTKIAEGIKESTTALQKVQKSVQMAEKDWNDLLDEKFPIANPPGSGTETSAFPIRPMLLKKLVQAPLPKNPGLADRLLVTGYGLEEPKPGKSKSSFEQARKDFMIQTILARTIFKDCISAPYRVNFVDQRLYARKNWVDSYSYDKSGNLMGWVRYDGTRADEFHAKGYLIEKKDDSGRCILGRIVKYSQAPQTERGLNENPLNWVPSTEGVKIVYGPNDPPEGTVLEKVTLPAK
jgi:hypothetical protein